MMFEDYDPKPQSARPSGTGKEKTQGKNVRMRKLNQRIMKDNFFEETALIGIVSTLEPYQLCWILNTQLATDFVCMPDMTIEMLLDNDTLLLFPVYQYKVPNSTVVHIMYKLRADNQFLLPGAQNKRFLSRLDYLWLIQSSAPDKEAELINKQLKEIHEIQLSSVLDPDQLEDRQNLLI